MVKHYLLHKATHIAVSFILNENLFRFCIISPSEVDFSHFST